jgi:hypothetical protein
MKRGLGSLVYSCLACGPISRKYSGTELSYSKTGHDYVLRIEEEQNRVEGKQQRRVDM